MLYIDFSSKDGLRNAGFEHVFQTQVATCCPHCPTDELFVGQKGFFWTVRERHKADSWLLKPLQL